MPNRKYTPEIIQEAVDNCTSIRGMLLYFDLRETGGNYEAMSKRIRRYSINIDHFTGRMWAKGQTKLTNTSIAALSRARTIPDDVVLSADADCLIGRHRLRTIVMKHKPYRCEECNSGAVWRDKPLTLHLDHINGDNRDNRLDNLRFLCPNCHQQTPTWGALNAKSKSLIP
jgi:5-methylcytosine-specific restriction endonuclease McrA